MSAEQHTTREQSKQAARAKTKALASGAMALVCVLGIACALATSGCKSNSSATSAPSADANTQAEAASSDYERQGVEFHGITLEAPADWEKEDLTDQSEGIEECMFLHPKSPDGIYNDGCMLYSTSYDLFGNITAPSSDGLTSEQQEQVKRNQACLKAIDARSFTQSLVTNNGLEVQLKDANLEDHDGHAVWTYEGMTDNGFLYCMSAVLDKSVVVVLVRTGDEQLPAKLTDIIESCGYVDKADENILDMAKQVQGMTEDETNAYAASLAFTVTSDSSSGATNSSTSSTDASANADSTDSSSNSDRSTYVDPYDGTVFTETDDDEMVSLEKDGTYTQYNDKGITTRNPDGSLEWTDGYGSVVRDVNGDGDPDYVSLDSGETWVEAP